MRSITNEVRAKCDGNPDSRITCVGESKKLKEKLTFGLGLKGGKRSLMREMLFKSPKSIGNRAYLENGNNSGLCG